MFYFSFTLKIKKLYIWLKLVYNNQLFPLDIIIFLIKNEYDMLYYIIFKKKFHASIIIL